MTDTTNPSPNRRPRVWFEGDTVPAGVITIAEPDDTPMYWHAQCTATTPEVEVIVPDYDTEVARARKERDQ